MKSSVPGGHNSNNLVQKLSLEGGIVNPIPLYWNHI